MVCVFLGALNLCSLHWKKMLIVFGILLMFTQETSGLLFQDPMVCNLDMNNQRYVAEGQQLHLPIPVVEKLYLGIINMTSTHAILRYNKRNHPNTTTYGLTTWKFVVANRTLILSSAKRKDSGNYSLETWSNGTPIRTISLQLNIEAQVSMVTISHNCLASGVMKVACSADGDNLRFKWTSDFNTQLENGSRAVQLDHNYQGNITCHVENHVSRDYSSIQLHPCPEPTTSRATTSESPSKESPDLGLIILSSGCVLLILMSVAAFCIYKKTHTTKNKEAVSQEGQELVFAQATHFSNGNTEPRSRTSQAQVEDVEYAVVVPRASKKKQKAYEDTVQYGELVFNTPAKNRHQTSKVEDDCIYSQVQHR